MIENMDMLNALARDLEELSLSSYKFECALDRGDKKLIYESLEYYDEIFQELQEGIDYLKRELKPRRSRIYVRNLSELH